MGVRLSIVTVVKDQPVEFNVTLESLSQLGYLTHAEIEFLVVDSSTSPEIKSLCEESPIINYVQTPPNGIYPAMNIGAQQGKGAFVFFLNSGDVLLMLPQQVLGLISEDADVIYFPTITHDDRNLIPLSLGMLLIGEIPFSHQGAITKKSLVHFNEQFSNHGDMELFLRLLLGQSEFYYVPKPFCQTDKMNMASRYKWRQRLEPYWALILHNQFGGALARFFASLFAKKIYSRNKCSVPSSLLWTPTKGRTY
jgi:hypothetical protein